MFLVLWATLLRPRVAPLRVYQMCDPDFDACAYPRTCSCVVSGMPVCCKQGV